MSLTAGCRGPVDALGMITVRSGTPVDEHTATFWTVDARDVRPPSVLTPMTGLTCDDARRPQFPHPLRRRRVHSLKEHVLITAGDDAIGDHRRIA